LRRKIFILDATIIPLCLSVFDWAKLQSRKGAIKLHFMLDYDGRLLVFADLTSSKVNEINISRQIEYPEGNILVFDLEYIDFNWLYVLDSKSRIRIEFVQLDYICAVKSISKDLPFQTVELSIL